MDASDFTSESPSRPKSERDTAPLAVRGDRAAIAFGARAFLASCAVECSNLQQETKEFVLDVLMCCLLDKDPRDYFCPGAYKGETVTMLRNWEIAKGYWQLRDADEKAAAAEKQLASEWDVDVETVRAAKRRYGPSVRAVARFLGNPSNDVFTAIAKARPSRRRGRKSR